MFVWVCVCTYIVVAVVVVVVVFVLVVVVAVIFLISVAILIVVLNVVCCVFCCFYFSFNRCVRVCVCVKLCFSLIFFTRHSLYVVNTFHGIANCFGFVYFGAHFIFISIHIYIPDRRTVHTHIVWIWNTHNVHNNIGYTTNNKMMCVFAGRPVWFVGLFVHSVSCAKY